MKKRALSSIIFSTFFILNFSNINAQIPTSSYSGKMYDGNKIIKVNAYLAGDAIKIEEGGLYSNIVIRGIKLYYRGDGIGYYMVDNLKLILVLSYPRNFRIELFKNFYK